MTPGQITGVRRVSEPCSDCIDGWCQMNCGAAKPDMSAFDEMKASIDRYVERGIPAGGFLEAVLSNDLFGAFAQADDTIRPHLYEVVRHIYWNVPSGCHGSPYKVTAWIRHGGLGGVKQWKKAEDAE